MCATHYFEEQNSKGYNDSDNARVPLKDLISIIEICVSKVN